MSSTANNFATQQAVAREKHPAQRAKNMTDAEKVQHLKKEIASLRSQMGIGSTSTNNNNNNNNNDPMTAFSPAMTSIPTESTTTFGHTLFSNMGTLSVVLLVAVALVTLWKRRVRHASSAAVRSFRRSHTTNGGEELTMTFELSDAHEYDLESRFDSSSLPSNTSYMAPPTSTSSTTSMMMTTL